MTLFCADAALCCAVLLFCSALLFCADAAVLGAAGKGCPVLLSREDGALERPKGSTANEVPVQMPEKAPHAAPSAVPVCRLTVEDNSGSRISTTVEWNVSPGLPPPQPPQPSRAFFINDTRSFEVVPAKWNISTQVYYQWTLENDWALTSSK